MKIVPRARLGWLVLSTVLFGSWLMAGPAAAASPPVRQQVVAVLPPTGDNIAPDLLRAARDILKDHLERAGCYTVLEPAIPLPTVVPPSAGPGAPPPPAAFAASSEEPTAAEAARLGSSVGAELALVLRLTHFGNSARLRLTAYATGTAQVAYWDSILINGGPDELDVAIERLVHGMQTGKPARESAELETVTDRETMALNRREANKSFGVRISSFLPFNSADGSFDAVTTGGLFWLYDSRNWMADVSGDIGGGANGRFVIDAAIGAYYPFLREDFTPYVGGVVRWAYMTLGGDGASGLTLQPTAGLLLGRLSSVQIRAEVGYFFNTFGEQELTAPNGVVSRHYSQGFVFSAGLGF